MDTFNNFSLLFKVVVGVALVSFVYTYYTYSQASAQQACAQYGAELDLKEYGSVDQQVKKGSITLTRYKFQGGSCYRSVVMGAGTSSLDSFIENAYTRQSISACVMANGAVSDVYKQDCNKYYKDYDNIFENVYGK